jgi:hypothetical protein
MISEEARPQNEFQWISNDVSQVVKLEAALIGSSILGVALALSLVYVLDGHAEGPRPWANLMVVAVGIGWAFFGLRLYAGRRYNPTGVALSPESLVLRYRDARGLESIPWDDIKRIEHRQRSPLISKNTSLLKIVCKTKRWWLWRDFKWIAVENEIARRVRESRKKRTPSTQERPG